MDDWLNDRDTKQLSQSSAAARSARNEVHFFVVLGILAGLAIGIVIGILATSVAMSERLQNWQTLMAATIALATAGIAFVGIRLQVNAGFRKDEVARAATTSERERSQKAAAHLLGELALDAMSFCRRAAESAGGSLQLYDGEGIPKPLAPNKYHLQSYQSYRAHETATKNTMSAAAEALSPVGKARALYLIAIIEKLWEATDVLVFSKGDDADRLTRQEKAREQITKLIKDHAATAKRMETGQYF